MHSLPTDAASLVARFPRLFKGQEPQLGIRIGAGWWSLLVTLFEEIDQALDDAQAKQFRVIQIKEKFAGLRAYYAIGGSTDAVLDLISPEGVVTMREAPRSNGDFPVETVDRLIAETNLRAQSTCERCGQPGILRLGGWTHVSCDECEARRGREE